MVGGKLDSHTIHTILTWMSTLHGVPNTQKSLLSQLETSKNPWNRDNRIGYLKDSNNNSKILQTIYKNGTLNVFHKSQ